MATGKNKLTFTKRDGSTFTKSFLTASSGNKAFSAWKSKGGKVVKARINARVTSTKKRIVSKSKAVSTAFKKVTLYIK